MTPKEKAIELYDKFHVWDTMTHQEVKTMTLIAINEIIDLHDYDFIPPNDFWGNVKNELKKL